MGTRAANSLSSGEDTGSSGVFEVIFKSKFCVAFKHALTSLLIRATYKSTPLTAVKAAREEGLEYRILSSKLTHRETCLIWERN
ncbi:hypothetical protein QVD99_007131 [Batrachochytrium dendrobatidis]|nr:hypothetical protein QVD99_007131 [Batrachochytrium dendrobatidis]